MIRRLGFVVLVVALMVSACGREVTPPRTTVGSSNAGTMQVKFLVNGPLSFAQYSYIVIFNTAGTSGNGVTETPEANASQNNYQNYSFAIVVTNVGGNPTATPYVFIRPNGNLSAPPVLYSPGVVSGQVQLLTNSNGLQTQFTVIFSRSLATFLASGVATATPSPTTSPTTSPSTSPSPTASASTSPSPTASSSSSPGSNSVTGVWYFNFFTVNGNVNAGTAITQTILLDSLGQNGPTDSTYQSKELDVLTSFDFQVTALAGIPPTDPATQIMGGEISNNP